MNIFDYKGYGRILVGNQDDAERVVEIIKEIDPEEFEGYFPKGFVTILGDQPEMIYAGKFDLDGPKFYEKCLRSGIPVWCIHTQRHPDDVT